MLSNPIYYKEIDAAYKRGDMIVVCWEPNCPMQRLAHWDEAIWVKRRRQTYGHYTHGICDRHAHLFRQQVQRHRALQAA